ncbi:MAG: ATP-binding protein, partial [Polyangiaceae bacterium]|nr:ATP-binding protein [Polyangiaceae bacterium]
MIPQLPVGTQTFSTIRRRGRCYVDKTAIIHRMITGGSDAVFLSRPRRFGKSLLCSTIAEVFRGNRELFGAIAGQPALAIDSLDWDWKAHPVIKLALRGTESGTTAEHLELTLHNALVTVARINGIELRDGPADVEFEGLIADMYLQNRQHVVILIDEYDDPLLDAIGNPDLLETTRKLLRRFYRVIKNSEEFLRFVFITGITKFSHVSVFSVLNHLKDISLDDNYADICGFTQEELEHNFEPHLAEILAKTGLSRDVYLDKVRRNYNGYRFSYADAKLYNPFGMLLHLSSLGRFEEYWYESGTPNFLVTLIKDQRINVANLGEFQMTSAALRKCDAARLDVIGLLYQSGYLTISDYDDMRQKFTLDFPNVEVKAAFAKTLIQLHVRVPDEPAESLYEKLPDALVRGDIKSAIDSIIAFLASIDYTITAPLEYYYETAIVLIFRIFGLNCRPEARIAHGRIDTLVETSAYVYCFEFKLNNDAEAALAQINTKGYLTPWKGQGKMLFEVGVGINKKIRNIGNWGYRTI